MGCEVAVATRRVPMRCGAVPVSQSRVHDGLESGPSLVHDVPLKWPAEAT
jgi:hypothetical protein